MCPDELFLDEAFAYTFRKVAFRRLPPVTTPHAVVDLVSHRGTPDAQSYGALFQKCSGPCPLIKTTTRTLLATTERKGVCGRREEGAEEGPSRGGGALSLLRRILYSCPKFSILPYPPCKQSTTRTSERQGYVSLSANVGGLPLERHFWGDWGWVGGCGSTGYKVVAKVYTSNPGPASA